MCFQGRSRFCLFCILLYSIIPYGILATKVDYMEATTNPTVKDVFQPPGHKDNDPTYQIKEIDSEIFETEYYLDKMMAEYGNGTVMTFEGFEHFLHKLGLGKIRMFDHSIQCHKSNSSNFHSFHATHNHSHTEPGSENSNISCKHDPSAAHGESSTEHIDKHDGHNHEHSDIDNVHKHSGTDNVHEHNVIDNVHKHSDTDNVHKHSDTDNVHKYSDTDNVHKHSDTDNVHQHSDTDNVHQHSETDNVHQHSDIDNVHQHSDTDNVHQHSDIDNVHQHSDSDNVHQHSETDNVNQLSDTDNVHKHSDTDNVHEHSDIGHDCGDHDNSDKSPTEQGAQVHEQVAIDITTRSLHSNSKRSTEELHKCVSATVFLDIGKNPDLQYVTKDMFLNLCPSLVFQISEDTCHDYHPDHAGYQDNHKESHHGNHHDDMEHSHDDNGVPIKTWSSGISAKVWVSSTIAVVIISLAGLLGVAVIPVMEKVFYNHMLQFLVALAVGSLAGDALLHLLPHAIGGEHGHSDIGADDEGHDRGPVYKGLCGLIGIYFFYFVERVITMVTDMKRRRKHSSNKEITGNDEIVRTEENLAADCEEIMMSVHPNKALQGYAEEAHSEHCAISLETTTSISHEHDKYKHRQDPEERVDELSETNSHGHGHSHCLDGAPNSIAALAWMMLLGDGIHNFSDGLAIGAAFSNSITGGFSTSIAIFCHELPHEIGDFALLLRAGMAPKQAIIYNCLSSVLCFIGMLIGVAIGNIENASLWIFAAVGGMFLYIALVDMLPVMSSVDPKKGEHPCCHLAIQLLGMFVGGSIMLVIAVYEDSLKTLLE